MYLSLVVKALFGNIRVEHSRRLLVMTIDTRIVRVLPGLKIDIL